MLFTLLVPVEVLQVGREGWHKEGRRLVNERRPTTKSKLITLLGVDSIDKKTGRKPGRNPRGHMYELQNWNLF